MAGVAVAAVCGRERGFTMKYMKGMKGLVVCWGGEDHYYAVVSPLWMPPEGELPRL